MRDGIGFLYLRRTTMGCRETRLLMRTTFLPQFHDPVPRNKARIQPI